MSQTGNEELNELEKKIEYYERELEKLENQRNFPFVYIVVAIPTTILFLILVFISDGLIDLTSGITGALFFSLLFTCGYLVLYQPNKDEIRRQLIHNIKSLKRKRGMLEAGIRGEKAVAHHLSWLPKNCVVLNDIKLPSNKFQPQQIDHLVIGPKGVFHIETKTINGIIVISPEGDWTLIKAINNNLLKEGMESPRHQIQRHEKVLREFLRTHFSGWKIPIISLVVMAHPKTIVEGEDPQLHVVKKDKLIDFITGDRFPDQLTDHQVKRIALSIATNSLE
ncbi:MAG: NERD domain-containing protein [Thermoanaerobacteraceae bacterium]|nr:NERD domain-containing protein [Thermoanaerobacteraceae bacterium]